MKRIGLFLLLTLACACAKEHKGVEPASKGTVLKATLSQLKTTIDGVKISWTAGDAICVNGQNSAALTEDAAVATFTFENALDAPYKAIYPTSLYKNASTVALPAVWNPFQVPLYGYLESGDEISFNSLLSIIKLSITAETETTLSRVVFKPLGGEQVSGNFTINYSTGALTATSSAEADKSVEVKVNQALGSEALTVYIPVPAGTYASGYYIDLINSEEEIMRCPVAARTLAAGDLRIMPALAFVPNVGPAILGGISNAAEFADFAAAVNAGESTAKWENEDGWVTLLADIDFTGVDSWTPVGDVTAAWGSSYNPVVTAGNAFTGKFDGDGHHIKNLALVDAGTQAGHHFGLFGYVGAGGIVKNLVIDETCSLTVTSSASHSAGVLAGVLYDATVEDITSYAPMTYAGACTGAFHMALIGFMYSNETYCTVNNVVNHGDIEAPNTENLNAGATGLHIAGIVGFANAGTGVNTITACKNYGDMTSQAGRTSGILAAANKNTSISYCENHGDQLNTMNKNDGGRLGNICCLTNNGSIISFCKNYGDLISTTAARVGGIVSLPNAAGEYEGNENYGYIISDSPYRGVLYGYLTAEVAWKGGVADGRVGTYNGGEYVYDMYTVANILNYLGKDGSSGKATYNDITINIPTIPATGGSIDDLNAVEDEWNF